GPGVTGSIFSGPPVTSGPSPDQSTVNPWGGWTDREVRRASETYASQLEKSPDEAALGRGPGRPLGPAAGRRLRTRLPRARLTSGGLIGRQCRWGGNSS